MSSLDLSVGAIDDLVSLKTRLQKVKLILVTNFYAEEKLYHYIKALITNINPKFFNSNEVIEILIIMIDDQIQSVFNKFNLIKIMHTLSFGIHNKWFMFSFCDLAAEVGFSVFTVINNHKKLLKNEKPTYPEMIKFMEDLHIFYKYGELNAKYRHSSRLPRRIGNALKSNLFTGSKRKRKDSINLVSDEEETSDIKYLYSQSFVCKKLKSNEVSEIWDLKLTKPKKSLPDVDEGDLSDSLSPPDIMYYDETERISESESSDQFFELSEEDSLEIISKTNCGTTPSLPNSNQVKFPNLNKLDDKEEANKIAEKGISGDTQLTPHYSEFYNRKKHRELLNCSDDMSFKRNVEIKLIFGEGYVNPKKNEKLLTTLNRLLKMKKSKTTKKFNVMMVTLDGQKYKIIERLGSGGFGVVYLAEAPTEDNFGVAYKAIKIQSSNSDWEFYINKVIAYRIKKALEAQQEEEAWPSQTTIDNRQCFNNLVKIDKNISFDDHSILIMDFVSSGTLLELSNYVRKDTEDLNSEQSRDIIATFFTMELMKIIKCLHGIGIIHGDLKADNCMVRVHLKGETRVIDEHNAICSLRLIDFGKSADMTFFEDSKKKFVHNLKQTDDQDCPEVREKRPFNYEIDYYGIAAVAHTLLFNEYIENRVDIVNGKKRYSIKKNIPRADREQWGPFFTVFMNSALSVDNLPMFEKLQFFINKFEQRLQANPRTDGVLKMVRSTLLEKQIHNNIR